MIRITFAALLALFLHLSCFAQMNYYNNGSTTDYSIVNNIPNCGVGSCWHSPPQQTNYAFLAVSVGGDGYVCGITTARGIMSSCAASLHLQSVTEGLQ